jgi:hypothetical protein
MSKRFLLFGEKPFDAYALDKFSVIASDIDKMSDVETLLYKDSFEELVSKTVNAYAFNSVDISFDNKMVDLVDRQVNNSKRYFAEYSLIVTGNTYYLGLTPYQSGFRQFKIPVEIRGNVLSFEIDTFYQHEELIPEITAQVKIEYERVKKYILDSLYNMNQTVMYYNSELEKFVIPLLANKLRKAERVVKIREALDFR